MSQIAVIGTGVIGTGWAARFLARGFDVVAWDPAPEFFPRLEAELKRLWPTLEKQGTAPSASLDRLREAKTLQQACENASWVQESAPERLDVKRELHQQIETATPADAIVGSSSSGLLPTDIQNAMKGGERMLIAHPFNPVYLLPLVELVGGEKTGAEVIERARTFYGEAGMRPLVVRREIEGYLSDRLQEAMWREILHLVNDDIASTDELDDAIVYGPGLRWALMGTCLTFHLAGGAGGMRHMLEQFGPALELPWTKLKAPVLNQQLIDRMVEGTARQAGDLSVEELEQIRDDFLIEMMEVTRRFQDKLKGSH